MCTIVVLNRVSSDWPVVIAANRDEFFHRPAAPPQRWPGEPALVAPVDESKGGTWMGIASGGFFVGVTNQRTWGHSRTDLDSRGQLVIDLLRSGSLEGARALLASRDARRYNPFNLLYGDASGLDVAYGRLDCADISIFEVPPGVHVLPNDVLDSPDTPKVRRIRGSLEDAASLTRAQLRTRLEAVLADRQRSPIDQVAEPPPGSPFTRALLHELDAVAIETPAYGTRSSSIVALDHGRAAGLWYTHQPPHRSEFEDLADLLVDL